MMRKVFVGRSILFAILSFLLFFFIGLFHAKLTDVGAGQGLAASAIVLGHGVQFGFFAMILSIILSFMISKQWVKKLNLILGIALIILIAVIAIMIKMKNS